MEEEIKYKLYYDDRDRHISFSNTINRMLNYPQLNPNFSPYIKYLFLVNKLLSNEFLLRNFMNIIFEDRSTFGRGTPESQIRKSIESRKELFASLHFLRPIDFKNWFKRPVRDFEILNAIKQFLISGRISYDVGVRTLTPFLYDEIKNSEFLNNNDILLLDGDNLYSHITPLFELDENIGMIVTFFKHGNISPYYSAYANYKKNLVRYNTIESEQSKKEAADICMNKYITRQLVQLINSRKNVPSRKMLIITGDESSEETIATHNAELRYLNLLKNYEEYLIRINSQIEGLEREHPWSIKNIDFPRKYYGDLLFKSREKGSKILERSEISIINLGYYLEGNLSENNNINVIVSSWVIQLIKRYKHKITNYEVEKILKLNDIRNYEDFIRYVDNIQDGGIRHRYKDQYLKIIGAKFFTNEELIRDFYNTHYELIKKIKNRYDIIYRPPRDGIYIVGINEEDEDIKYYLNQFIGTKPANYDILSTFYTNIDFKQLYYNYIDIDIALGIIHIEIDILPIRRNPRLEFIENVRLYPEDVYIKSITFQD